MRCRKMRNSSGLPCSASTNGEWSIPASWSSWALPTNIKKVAALLLSMAYRTGHFRDGGTIIPIRMTHELIAKIIYSDRVSVSRAVSKLEKRGLIRLRNSEYCILDFVGLTDIVEE